MANNSYQQTINEWRKERDETIRKENGWLSLIGLYWLKLGKNQLGSDARSEIQLPERIPANIGYLEYNGKSVTLRTNPGQKINVNDQQTDLAILQPDISDDPSYINVQDIRLVVIQRGIDEVFTNHLRRNAQGKINTVRYCEDAIKRHWKNHTEAHVGGHGNNGNAGFCAFRIQHLENGASDIGRLANGGRKMHAQTR